MVTLNEIEQQKKAIIRLQEDEDYQSMIGDIRACTNNVKVIQTSRIRYSNRCNKKADGSLTKNAAEVREIVKTSDSYNDFAEAQLKKTQDVEDGFTEYLGKIVKKHPVFSDWLVNVPGISTAIAGTILSEFKPERVYYVGQLFSYAGIIGDTSRKRGEKCHHNTFLKSRLLGVLGESFLKGESEYAIYYYQCMIKQLTLYLNGDEQYRKEHPPVRMMRHSVRWMIQRFVKDYYIAWRKIMRFPIIKSYEEEKLGMVHVGNEFTSFDTFYKVPSKGKEYEERRAATRAKIDELHQKVDELKVKCGFAKTLDELKTSVKTHPEFAGLTYAEIRQKKAELGITRGRKKKTSDVEDE